MGFVHVHTSMVRFLRNAVFKALGAPTRCKLNVDQDQTIDHAPKSGCVNFIFEIYVRKGNFEILRVLFSPLLFPLQPSNV
jgi:hypothetical protein